MNRSPEWEPLSSLPGLQQWCDEERFAVEDVDVDETAITSRESGSTWSLFRVGGWLQIKGLMFEEVSADLPLCISLARLHSRLLGCRYGLGDNSTLWLHADLFPSEQSGSAVGATIIQMQSIVDHTYDLLLRVQQSGISVDDATIDEAFQLPGHGPLN